MIVTSLNLVVLDFRNAYSEWFKLVSISSAKFPDRDLLMLAVILRTDREYFQPVLEAAADNAIAKLLLNEELLTQVVSSIKRVRGCGQALEPGRSKAL